MITITTITATMQRSPASCSTFDEPLDWNGRVATGSRICAARAAQTCCGSRAFSISATNDVPVVIHGVHHVFHPPVALHKWPDADRRSRIVFITRGIARDEVLALWQAGRAAA